MGLSSCESHEQKADDAFDIVKQERMFPKDSIHAKEEIIEEAKKTEVVKKKENQDEWTKFRTDMEKRIALNEIKIKEIKNTPNATSKLLKKVANLEKDNNDLREEMEEYYQDMKAKWENFKLKLNHDANDVDLELKALVVNNKK